MAHRLPDELGGNGSSDLGRLSIVLGPYEWVEPLRHADIRIGGRVLHFETVEPLFRAFASMAREARFDICELAIATGLQARAFGKPITLLPFALSVRAQEKFLFCAKGSAIRRPEDLVGRRIGVRSYAQTTVMWIRGILAEACQVLPEQMDWVTLEDAHVAEYRDPPWASRAVPGSELTTMLREGAIDAAILATDNPGDDFRPVFEDPAAAARDFAHRHGFVPINHLLAVRTAVLGQDRVLCDETMSLLDQAWRRSGMSGDGPRIARDHPAVGTALRFAREQGLVAPTLQLADVWGD